VRESVKIVTPVTNQHSLSMKYRGSILGGESWIWTIDKSLSPFKRRKWKPSRVRPERAGWDL